MSALDLATPKKRKAKVIYSSRGVALPRLDSSYNGEYRAREDEKLPLILFPSGSVCWDATDFCLDLFMGIAGKPNYQQEGGRKQSKSIRPGSIKQYANNLAQLLNFLEDRSTLAQNAFTFVDMNDDDLDDFAGYVRTEAMKNPRVKLVEKRVHSAITCCMYFLDWLRANRRAPQDLICISEHQNDSNSCYAINVKAVRRSRTSMYDSYSLEHYALPSAVSRYSKRRYLEAPELSRIAKAVKEHSNNPFMVRRLQALCCGLEYLGGRVSEIVSIKASEIEKAYRSGLQTVSIELVTTKGIMNGTKRRIPISRQNFLALHDFMLARNQHMRSLSISQSEHDRLFIDQKGQPLSASQASELFQNLKKKCPDLLSIAAIAHRYRHLFITRLVAEKMQRYANHGLRDFQVATAILSEVMCLTGHASIDSMMHYSTDAMSYNESLPQNANDALALPEPPSDHLNSSAPSLADRLSTELLTDLEDIFSSL